MLIRTMLLASTTYLLDDVNFNDPVTIDGSSVSVGSSSVVIRGTSGINRIAIVLTTRRRPRD